MNWHANEVVDDPGGVEGDSRGVVDKLATCAVTNLVRGIDRATDRSPGREPLVST